MSLPRGASERAAPAQPRRVTGVILAGGLGRRMRVDGCGLDKGLQPLRGRPMLAHVIERLAAQVDALLLNANGDPGRWQAFGLPVIADLLPGSIGPLAGLHAGLRAARTERVLIVPCDAPFLPADLAARLAGALDAGTASVAVARTGAQPQPVFLMAERSVMQELEGFLARGRRSVEAWYLGVAHVEVDFPDEAAFRNINTPEDLRACQAE